MENMDKSGSGLLITYDQSMDIRELMKLSLDEANIRNINRDISKENFDKLPSVGVRMVSLRVEPYLKIETSEQAVKRLVATGHTLANLKDLAGFMRAHSEEAAKWWWIFALSEDSRWTCYGSTMVVYANMQNFRGYTHWGFRDHVSSTDTDRNGILVVERVV
jgi:hypothetical protein